MSVAHHQNVLCHGVAHHAAHHLCHASKGNIIDEQQIQIRLSVCNGLIDFPRQNFISQPGNGIFRVNQLADCIIDAQ